MKLNLFCSRSCVLTVAVLMFSLNSFAIDYYVDSQSGNDGWDGKSAATAWKNISKVNSISAFQPGDRILFKRGCSWTNTLRPKGSGGWTPTGYKRIVIGAYGNHADKPKIHGGGVASTSFESHEGATILLVNQSYWTIQDIEVTNFSTSQGFRQGIKIVAEDSVTPASGKTVEEITIKNVTVRNVFGKYHFNYDQGKGTGGINLFFFRPSGASSTTKVLSKFKNIRIEENIIEDITRCGIFINGSNNIHAEDSFDPEAYPVTGLVIRRNKIKNCTGDGVIVRFADSAIVESNLAIGNHSGSEDTSQVNYVGHGVALWCRSTKNTIFQYNEVYGTLGKLDGCAFDADIAAIGTIIQYNYSHDNEGGFALFMQSQQEVPGTIVRYNISQNDGNKANRIFHFSLEPQKAGYYKSTALIYNNTFYIDDKVYSGTDASTKIAISNTTSYKTKFYNNIFIQPNNVAMLNRAANFALWQHNHFQNFSNVPNTSPNINNSQGVANLNNPGAGANLNTPNDERGTRSAALPPNDVSTLGTQLDCYKITSASSPAYQSGLLMAANGGRDFYGIGVGSGNPNKGAHNGLLSSGFMAFSPNKSLLNVNLKSENQQILYPNPVLNTLSISNLPNDIYTIEVLDVTGKRILKTQLIKGEASLSTLESGNYILQFPDHPELKRYQFIKAK